MYMYCICVWVKLMPNLSDLLPQIKQKRCSGDAEENILRFLQACTTLGVKKVQGVCRE